MEKEEKPNSSKQEQREQKKSPQEIERKFLIRALPECLEVYPRKEHWHGYLAVDSDGTEVRLRQIEDENGNIKYSQTVKQGAGKVRTEIKIKLSKEQFQLLWPLTENKRIIKTRYKIPYSGGMVELDVYHDELEGLIVAEIEFESEEKSDQFAPLDWFGQEITEDQRYKNQSLAARGFPE